MKQLRENAHNEIHDVCTELLDIRGFDRYSLEDTKSKRGKNWTNLCTVHLSDSETTGNIKSAVERLEDLDYIAHAGLKHDSFRIEVKLTSDASDRLQN